VEDWSLHVLPPESLLLTRGLISADIDAGENRTLRVLATHLHHQANGGAIRLEQVEEIRRVWDGAENTVIAGDLNAESDKEELRPLREAGLAEVLNLSNTEPGYTYSSSSPERRIDYLWISPDLAPEEVRITQGTASDHLGVVAALSFLP